MFLSFLAIPICPFKWNYGYLGILEATSVASEEILLDTTVLDYYLQFKHSSIFFAYKYFWTPLSYSLKSAFITNYESNSNLLETDVNYW